MEETRPSDYDGNFIKFSRLSEQNGDRLVKNPDTELKRINNYLTLETLEVHIAGRLYTE